MSFHEESPKNNTILYYKVYYANITFLRYLLSQNVNNSNYYVVFYYLLLLTVYQSFTLWFKKSNILLSNDFRAVMHKNATWSYKIPNGYFFKSTCFVMIFVTILLFTLSQRTSIIRAVGDDRTGT